MSLDKFNHEWALCEAYYLLLNFIQGNLLRCVNKDDYGDTTYFNLYASMRC